MAFTPTSIYDSLRSAARGTPIADILQQPVSLPLGVNANAQSALQKLDVSSIFDLASTVVFNNAVKLAAAATDPQSVLYQHGKVLTDVLQASRAAEISVNKIQDQRIVLLNGVPQADADTTSQALDVETIRDLAVYSPFLAASRIMKATYFPQEVVKYDPEYPSDLVPSTCQFPVEKVQYSTLHIGEIRTTANLTDISSPKFQTPSLENLATVDTVGFKTVATGALLTFSQAWFALGITLGHLLSVVNNK